jgi:predicted metal-dependent peptidase
MFDLRQDWLFRVVSAPSFLRRYPLYAAILASVDPIADPGVAVMAVSLAGRRFRLHVNLDFFADRAEFLHGVLLHEVHHIVFGHLSLSKFHGVAQPDLMELACELAANEPIREPLPGRPVRWEDYTELGLRPGQSTLQRYRILVAARARGQANATEAQWVDEHLPNGVGAVYGLPSGEREASASRLSRLIEAAGTPWQGHAGLGGRDPGELVEELQESADSEGDRRLDWREVLRFFVARLRQSSPSYRWPNRRQPHRVGEVPGRVRRAGGDKPRLVAAIDTSGSMTHHELGRIAHQLTRLKDLAQITVAECDARVQRVYPFSGSFSQVKGRGGTDLRPVFARSFLDKQRPDGVVYFTDGLGPYPEEDPGVRTLWVLTKTDRFACPWGQRVYLPGVGVPNRLLARSATA